MVPEPEHEADKEPAVIPPFHQRFNIEIDRDEAERRFINRIINKIEQDLSHFLKYINQGHYEEAIYNVATRLGIEYDPNRFFHQYVRNDFYACLQSLEAIYEVFTREAEYDAEKLENLIQYSLSLSETDLGITWRNGSFWPSGAKLLDEALLNENLEWLSNSDFHGVFVPFEKGLRHFLEAHRQTEKLADTVTDMYEAMEAMAKIVCNNDWDLSRNKELFISKLRLSTSYKKMLGDYIEYANQYRHGIKPGEKRESPKRNEVEAFFYTTGLFIRLAVQQMTST